MKSFFKKIFSFSKGSKIDFRWLESLPVLKGKVILNEPLNKKNWFGVGGVAQIYIEPYDENDLKILFQHMPVMPLSVLGAGSNVLIRDGGIPGVTLKLGKGFSGIVVEEDTVRVGGASLVKEVAREAERNNLSGFEFLCGIPGTLGGAIRMNAGAHGSSVSSILQELKILNRKGEIQVLSGSDFKDVFSYRQCHFPADWIFLEAVFKGKKVQDGAVISQKMLEYKQKRESAQPQGVRTAGSTFKNPDGVAAWQLIERAGLKGYSVGGAVVSDKHANFLINRGNATARDIEALGETIRKKVFEKEGVLLDWEVKKMGVDQL